MERKQASFVEALIRLANSRVAQLEKEGLTEMEAIKRARAEIAFGQSLTWPGSDIIDKLKVHAFNGVRPDLEMSGGSVYRRTFD